jgi:hypothetical protein
VTLGLERAHAECHGQGESLEEDGWVES